MSLEIKLDQILKNYAEIEKELAGNLGDDPKKYAKLSKKFADLGELVSKIKDFNKFKKELDDLDSLLESDDDEMKEFAFIEKEKLQKEKIPCRSRNLRRCFLWSTSCRNRG